MMTTKPNLGWLITEWRLPKPPKAQPTRTAEALKCYQQAHDRRGQAQRKAFGLLDDAIKGMNERELAAYYEQVRARRRKAEPRL